MIGKKVLVTGASGHVGITLTEMLVERGYQVRASVRTRNGSAGVQNLQKLGVDIVEADITNIDQMVRAAEGMDGIFHVAAVFKFDIKNPERDIIGPNVQGVLNALEAAKMNNVKRVVYTSSSVVLGNTTTHDRPFTEESWDTESRIPYNMAKTQAEKEAWDYACKHDIDMISINPGLIIGPNYQKLTPSTKMIEDIYNGVMPAIIPISFNTIDVRDVALIHILAYEKEDAKGRYIVATKPMSNEQLVGKMKELDTSIEVPTRKLPKQAFIMYARVTSFFSKLRNKPPMITVQQAKEYVNSARWVDLSKTKKEFNWQPMPLEKSLKDSIKWIQDKKVL